MSGREILLAAAKRCLVDRGWGATTVRDIAATAGMSHAAIGYHFGSRDALMSEALIGAVAQLGQELATPAGDPLDQPDPRRWQALLDSVGSHRELWIAQLEAIRHAQHSPEIRRILIDGQHQAQQGLGGGAVQALLLGLVVQTLVDPAQALTAAQALQELQQLGPPATRRPAPR